MFDQLESAIFELLGTCKQTMYDIGYYTILSFVGRVNSTTRWLFNPITIVMAFMFILSKKNIYEKNLFEIFFMFYELKRNSRKIDITIPKHIKFNQLNCRFFRIKRTMQFMADSIYRA
jgi:hypothetical protein